MADAVLESVRISDDALDALRAQQGEARRLLSRLADDQAPQLGAFLAAQTTACTDELVLGVVDAARTVLDDETAAAGARVALVALGSYGRRELCPYSDVDLLFLVPAQADERIRTFVNTVLYGLWDLNLEVGHAVRTVLETVKAARNDQSTTSGLLDARLLDGPEEGTAEREEAYQSLVGAMQTTLSGERAAEFIEEKLGEAKRRRKRYGNTVFLLEPNVKESDGGLRELHTAMWVARARWRTPRVEDLLRLGVLSTREGRSLLRSYGFMLRVRAELHLAAQRRQDNLQFAHQETVATRLGYVDPAELDLDRRTHGVERFMRAYYFNAKQLALLSKLIVERATSHRTRRQLHARSAPGDFKLWNQMLTVKERTQFERDPAALMRIFRVAQEESLEIYSYTKDLIVESRALFDRRLRRDRDVVRDFLAVLEDPRNDATTVRTMHDLGVLRRMIPEWARITARWQHSLYHVYTVDEHSIVVFDNLKQLKLGGYEEGARHFAKVLSDLPRPAVVYLAGLLHDVGKGWPRGDHSIRGAKVARVAGRRLEAAALDAWTEEETEDLAWLVEKHLLMSDISQRRDMSDPNLISAFAEDVRSVERLSMLYVLTYADMKGTSPKVWTEWKGALLRELYEQACAVVRKGSSTAAAHFAARRRQALAYLLEAREERNLDEVTVRAFAELMPERYMLSYPARRMLRHVEMWRDVSRRGGLAVHVQHLRREGSTRMSVVCPDRPGLLALLAGVLAAHRLQVMSAQIFSIDLRNAEVGDGRAALDVLFVQDERGRICDDKERWAAVRADLERALDGAIDVPAILEHHRTGSSLDPRTRPNVKTEIEVHGDESEAETVIDVFCQDHLGVLHTITKALADQGLSISLAKISTQGDRVADGFYVTDAKTGAKVTDAARLAEITAFLESRIAAASA